MSDSESEEELRDSSSRRRRRRKHSSDGHSRSSRSSRRHRSSRSRSASISSGSAELEEDEAPTAHAINDVELVRSSRNLMANSHNHHKAKEKSVASTNHLEVVGDVDDNSESHGKRKSRVGSMCCALFGVTMIVIGAGFMLRYRRCETCDD